jgi:hypothetical protein
MSDNNRIPSPKPAFDYSNANWQLLNRYFEQANWDQALHLQHQDMDAAWSDFKNILERGLRSYTRVIRNQKNQAQHRPIQLGHEALQMKRDMQNAWNQHKTRNTPQTYSQYCSRRNRYTQAVREAKRANDERIAEQMANSTNPKTWYNLCRKLYKGSAIRDSIPSLSTPEQIATTAAEKASILNQAFVAKASNTPNKAMPPLKIHTTKCLDNIEITRPKVLKTLQQLDTTKAPGPDRIHNIVLKNCAASLCNPLATLFQRSLAEGVLPSEWKLAEVTALYKHKGARNDPNNYRPISLTSSICKIMERLVNDALLKHLTANNLITANQFGFLPKHSTTDQLAYLLHELHESLNGKKITIACFLDLAAAFDTVPHAAIIHKLPAYGIRGHLLRWITNFLKDRKQYVSVNRQDSPTFPVRSGVPQGSVVAPTLFLIFMNDLSTSIAHHSSSISLVTPSEESGDHLMYADDTMVYFSGFSLTSTAQSMNSTLEIIDQWATTWSMRFNHTKTHAMIFNSAELPDNLTFASHPVSFVPTHKHLGYTLSANLSFTPHIDTICRKTASEIFLLKRLSLTCRNSTILKRTYKSFILPIFEYASPAWAGLLISDKNRLERLQRRAIRIILGLDYTHPLTSDHYSAAAIQTLQHRRHFASLCYGYKLANVLLPAKLKRLQPTYTEHHYPTRNPSLTIPKIPIRSLRALDRSPLCVAIRLLNKLPSITRHLPSLEEFKNEICTLQLDTII